MSIPAIPSIPGFTGSTTVPDIGYPSLANSLFSAGPSDELITPDIYSIKSAFGNSKPITSIQELSQSINTNILGTQLGAGDIPDFLSKLESGYLSFDKDLLTNRILGTSNEFKTACSELNDLVKNGAAINTYKDQAKKIVATIGEVKTVVDSTNIKDVRALGSFINKYTGLQIFSGKDKGAIAGLLGAVVNRSSDLGIGGAFKSLTDTLNDDGIIGRVSRAVLPIVVKNSDSKLLREISTSSASKLINVLSPGFTQDFSKAFTFRGTRGTTLNTFEDVFTSFENINDQWSGISRGSNNSEHAVNIFSVVTGTRDFQNLVMTGVRYWVTEQNKPGGNPTPPPVPIEPMMALATSYREISVGEAIKRDFPKVALLNSYNGRLPTKVGKTPGLRSNKNVDVIDPRMIQGGIGALLGL